MAHPNLIQQDAPKFLGVNLRRERMDLADEELAKAINVDLNTRAGMILGRRGRSKLYSSPLPDLVVRLLTRGDSRRYQVAGQRIYRDRALIKTTLSSELHTTVDFYRPLNDTTTWAWIADPGGMFKDNGFAADAYNWGIEAPTVTPSVGVTGTGLTGTFKVKFTYARVVGSAVVHESNPSPASAAQALANQNLAISGLTASTDPQVTHIRIYRTLNSGTRYLFDQQIANGTTTATSSSADSALGNEVEEDNDPPEACSWVAFFNETAFLLGDPDNPNYLYISKRFRPEAVPDFIEVGEANRPLQCAMSIAGVLGVFNNHTKYRVTGNATSGYVATEHIGHRGTRSPRATAVSEYGIVFPAKDGVFLTNFLGPDQQLADDILPLFYGETVNDLSPINWTVADKFCGLAYKDRYYFAYASGSNTNPDTVAVFSQYTKKWYFYQYSNPVTALFYEEDEEQIVSGSTDGFVYVLDDLSATGDSGSNISASVETKDYHGQQSNTRKVFLFFRVDAYVPSGTLTASFYVDGTSKRTATITGNRTKRLLRLPEECMGYQWRLAFSYSGTGRVEIYGVSALWLPLGGA